MTSIDRNGMRIHFPLTPVNKGRKKRKAEADNSPRPSPRPQGRWFRPQEKPLRAAPPGRVGALRDFRLTPTA
jgi:hypothetical protein